MWTSEVIKATSLLEEEKILDYNDLTYEKRYYDFYVGDVIRRKYTRDGFFGLLNEECEQLLTSIDPFSDPYEFVEIETADDYFSLLFNSVAEALSNDESVVCGCPIIDDTISYIYELYGKKHLYRKEEIALHSMNIMLPYIRDAETEDILFIRDAARDEIIALRSYINTIVKEISEDKELQANWIAIQEKLEQRLIPSIRNLERSIQNTKLTSVQGFIKSMANPLCYAPLITTFFSVPPAFALAGSIAAIGSISAINYKINENELKNDSLYFSVSLKKKLFS